MKKNSKFCISKRLLTLIFIGLIILFIGIVFSNINNSQTINSKASTILPTTHIYLNIKLYGLTPTKSPTPIIKPSLTPVPTKIPTNTNYGQNYGNKCNEVIEYGKCLTHSSYRCVGCSNININCLRPDNDCNNGSLPICLYNDKLIKPVITGVTVTQNLLSPSLSTAGKCLVPKYIVIHYNGDGRFGLNQGTYEALKTRGSMCHFGVDYTGVLQMGRMYDNITEEEKCLTGYGNTISIEMSGARFAIFINNNLEIVNPYTNSAIETDPYYLGLIGAPTTNRTVNIQYRNTIIEKLKNQFATSYGVPISSINWENEAILSKVRTEIEITAKLVKWIMTKYSLTVNNLYGHHDLNDYKSPDEMGERFMRLIKSKL